MTKSESLLVRRILKALNGHPGIKAIKIHGSPYMEVGTPDIMGCDTGKIFVFEVKTDDGKVSNIQLKRLGEWAAVGATAWVIRSVDEALEKLGRSNETD